MARIRHLSGRIFKPIPREAEETVGWTVFEILYGLPHEVERYLRASFK